ncbi:MAG TPA: GNAT family N-acetyltransferase [Niastella sp.]
MIIFETDRLIVRRYTPADQENFNRLNGDPEIMRYIREAKDPQECIVILKRNITFYEQNPLMGRWAMIEKATGAFVGSFAIIPVETVDHSRHAEIQIGYALLKEYWGKGFATESTLAGLQYAFDVMKLPKIVAITEIKNIASQKVLQRSGFIQQQNIVEANRALCYFSKQNPNAIETQRLHLFPLTIPQLELYLKGNDGLEEALGLTRFGRTMVPQVHDRVKKVTLPKMKEAEADYLFYTFWLVVEKQSKLIVAEMGFKGPPTNGGQVEIGYGTMPSMRNKGIMTEAVQGLLQWAVSRADINQVLAETHTSNLPSIRVAEKCGFERFETKGENLWWKVQV